MVFKSEIITWKLKKGVTLPYGPAPIEAQLETVKDDTSSVPQQNPNVPVQPVQSDRVEPLLSSEPLNNTAVYVQKVNTDFDNLNAVNSQNQPENPQSEIKAANPYTPAEPQYEVMEKGVVDAPVKSFNPTSNKIALDAENQRVNSYSNNQTYDSVPNESLANSQPQKTPEILKNPESNPESIQKYNAFKVQPKQDENESLVPQSYPPKERIVSFNPSTLNPVVDGVMIQNTNHSSVNPSSRWMSLPYRLRPKRADVFVDMQSLADFRDSLTNFLKSKGLDVKEYNDEYHYLPSDILIVDANRIVDCGTVLVFQRGKRFIWDALLKEFGARLNAK